MSLSPYPIPQGQVMAVWFLVVGSYDFTMASSHRTLNMAVPHTLQLSCWKGSVHTSRSPISSSQVSEGLKKKRE